MHESHIPCVPGRTITMMLLEIVVLYNTETQSNFRDNSSRVTLLVDPHKDSDSGSGSDSDSDIQ